MTSFLYLDEQTASIAGSEFTAIAGFLIPVEEVIGIRERFYSLLITTLEIVKFSEDGRTRNIESVPILHGVDFLRDYSDEVKFKVLDGIFDILANSGARYFRIGYFHDSLGDFSVLGPRQAAINAALTSIWYSFEVVNDVVLVISEMDKQELKRSFRSLSSEMGFYHAVSSNTVGVPIAKLLGHTFALKSEFGCQIADLISYICLRFSESKSGFQERYGSYFDVIKSRFIINEIVWVNDLERNIEFEQDYHRPLRNAYTIVPGRKL